jgi:hypothetical protein
MSRRTSRYAWLAVGLLILSSLPAAAEPGFTSGEDGIADAAGAGAEQGAWIRSEPQGALVELGGAAKVRGFTPWRLDDRIRGSYHVNAHMPGYESWEGNIHLDGSRNDQYTIELSPKTRSKALLRSLFVPGWGQRYAGHKSRGNVFLAAEVGALVGLLITNEHYQNQVSDWEKARDAYLSEDLEERLGSRYEDLVESRDDADGAYTLRQTFFWSAAGIMAFNMLDVLLFTDVGPSSGVFLVSPSPPVAGAGDEAGAQVGVAYRF